MRYWSIVTIAIQKCCQKCNQCAISKSSGQLARAHVDHLHTMKPLQVYRLPVDFQLPTIVILGYTG